MSAIGTFGYLVRTRRRALDLTQEDLAHRVGYSVITIRKVESDERRPSRQLAELLARGLKIAPEQQLAFTALARAESGEPDPLLFEQIRDGRPSGARAEQSTNLPQPLTRLIGREDEVCNLRPGAEGRPPGHPRRASRDRQEPTWGSGGGNDALRLP